MIIDKDYIKSNFVSPYNIKEILLFIDEIDEEYNYEYKNIKIKVYYRKNKDILDINLIHKVLKRGTDIINHKNFNIILLLTPVVKEICYNKPLYVNNVNSGFTYTTRNEIFIFRKEEFPKVILHELLHHDINIHNDKFSLYNKHKLLKHFNLSIDSELILNESIIEFWATILHLSYISKEYNLDFKSLIKIEIEYSLYKCYQIFKLKQKNKLYYDKSNIYSYIIFKTIFLVYFDQFKKIYTFPYDDTKITDFILKYSYLKKVKNNPLFNFKGNIIQRKDDSLCFMLLSDL